VRHVRALERSDQPDLAQQFVEPLVVGALPGHPQHHAVIAARDTQQRVLRPTGNGFYLGQFAMPGRILTVEPAA
jgi:hypothetical protein